MGLLSKVAVDITPLKISRDYRLLFFGQLISFFGTMMTFIVVPVQMFSLTGSSLQVGLLGVAEFVPMFFLAFVGGALADSLTAERCFGSRKSDRQSRRYSYSATHCFRNPMVWVLYVAVGIHARLGGFPKTFV